MKPILLCVGIAFSGLAGCVSTPLENEKTSVDAQAKSVPYGEAHPDAPPELSQFGRFAGRWTCGVNERRPDGSWRTRPDNVIWTFFYTLNGFAVQDIWTSDDPGQMSEGVATNLRVYNPSSQSWNVSWTNTAEARFELWSGAMTNDELVLTSVRERRPVKIRFFNALPRQFQWSYEAATSTAGTEFMPVMQMLCQLQD